MSSLAPRPVAPSLAARHHGRSRACVVAVIAMTAAGTWRTPPAPVSAQASLVEGYRLVETWTSRTPSGDVAQLRQPAGVEVAADDTVFAVDQQAGAVLHLDASGGVLHRWQVDASVGVPSHVAASTSRAYVIGSSGAEMRDHSGQLIRTLAISGATGVAIGPDGRVYVARRTGYGLNGNTLLDVLDSDGTVVSTWQDDPFFILAPRGLDVGPDGTVYLAADGAIYVFRAGAVTGGLRLPTALEGGELLDVAVDSAGRVYAAEGGNTRRIVVWDAATQQVVDNAAFPGIQSLAVGPGGGLIVSVYLLGGFAGLSYIADRTQLADTPLNWGDTDSELGVIVGPRRLSTSRQGDLYFVDKRERVQRWTSAGAPREIWPNDDLGYTNDVIGGGDQPCAIGARLVACLGPGQRTAWSTVPDVDGWQVAGDGSATEIVVVDLAAQQVRRLSRAGQLLGQWALASGNAFASVADVAVDGNRLYIVDRGAHAVLVRTIAGQPSGPGEIRVPGEAERVAARDGYLYALSREGWIWKYDAAGGLRTVWKPTADGAASDLAVGPSGRVYVADTTRDRILVFMPDGEIPTAVPPEPDVRCVLEVDKWVEPTTVVYGASAAVTLAVRGTCPSGDGRLDIVLAVDQSGSMTGNPLAAAQAAAVAFLGQLNPAGAQVAVVGFSTTATVLQPLTGDLRDVVRAIGRLTPGGQTNYTDALDQARSELTGVSARSDVPQIVVMMTDGKPTDRTLVIRAANDLKRLGVDLYTIGLGTNLDPDLLRSMASLPELYFEAPSEAELSGVYGVIARRVTASRLLNTGTVVDELPIDMTFVAGSASPTPQISGRTLTWSLTDVRSSGTLLTYDVRPRRLGRHPTNVMATLDYVDASGRSGAAVFPVPAVDVVAPSRWTAQLPMVWKNRCKPQRADVVLVFDTSTSMNAAARNGSAETKLDAALAAGRAFLSAMQFPDDQAAVIAFDNEARRIQALTSSRGSIELSMGSIATAPGTRIDKGLELAIAELLSARHRERNNPVIILLSDGLPVAGTEGRAYAMARDAYDAGITLFTIGLGPDVDPDLLWLLAGDASRALIAPDADALRSIYDHVAGRVLCY